MWNGVQKLCKFKRRSKIPFPDRKVVSAWLAQYCRQVSELCIQCTFDHIDMVKKLTGSLKLRIQIHHNLLLVVIRQTV